LPVLGALPGYDFVIPDQVYKEVTEPAQLQVLDTALKQGIICMEPVTAIDALSLYASLRTRLGAGEAACIAIADQNGWMIASDEGRVFRREVLARFGEKRLLTTVQIYRIAIGTGSGCLRVTNSGCRFDRFESSSCDQ